MHAAGVVPAGTARFARLCDELARALATAREHGRRERDAEVAELRAEVERLRGGQRVVVIGDAGSGAFHARIADVLRENAPTANIEPGPLNPDALRRLEEMATAALPPKSGTTRPMRRAETKRKLRGAPMPPEKPDAE